MGGATSIVKYALVAGIAFIIVGIALQFGPDMLTGFEAMRTAENVSEYTGLSTVVGFGPTLIVLGFVIAVGVAGFMGLKLWGKKG